MSSLLVIFVRGGETLLYIGSEPGQNQSVKLLQNMVYNTTQPSSTLPPTATHRLYILYMEGGEGGGGVQREGIEGQQFTSIVPPSMGATVHKLGRNYQP